jgi:catechol 2,3-dioxygenase-like lactoylglutathione lyase family enzyme
MYNFLEGGGDTFGVKLLTMLGKYDIMAFVSTAEAAVARPFYEEKLGLTVRETDDYGIVYDANGIRLRLSFVQELHPAPYSILCWVVPDIYVMVAGLKAKGVVFEQYDGLGQDEAGVWMAPGGTRVAWFKDPDGNVLSLAQWAV